jgi:hypothetical protein
VPEKSGSSVSLNRPGNVRLERSSADRFSTVCCGPWSQYRAKIAQQTGTAKKQYARFAHSSHCRTDKVNATST